jgi:hypothetical protein
MDATQLRYEIVKPALELIGLHSKAAENLVMGTAAQESHLKYVKQIKGPALSIFQIEPATYLDYWDNYLDLPGKSKLKEKILKALDVDDQPLHDRLVYDLRMGAIMCRIHYRRIRAPLPRFNDIKGMAEYWKKYYNTKYGRGTVDEFIQNYAKVEEKKSRK